MNKIFAYFLIGFLIVICTNTNAQTHEIDSLKKLVLLKSTPDSVRIKCYTGISIRLLKNRFLNESQIYADKAVTLASKINNIRAYTEAAYQLGNNYAETGRYSDAVSLIRKFISYSKKTKNRKAEMGGYNSLGLTYYNWGKFRLSLTNHLKGIKIAEELKDTASMARYYSNLGRVYYSINSLDKAIGYTLKSIELEKKYGHSPENVIIRSINLGSYYSESNNAQKAIVLLTDALAYNASIVKSQTYDAYLRSNLGHAYLKAKQYKSSVPEFLKARKAFMAIPDSGIVAQIDINIAYSLAESGNVNEALKYVSTGLKMHRLISDIESQIYANHVASMVYEKAGKTSEALIHAKKVIELKDTLFNRDQLQGVNEMQAAFETEKKEDSLKYSRKDLAFQKRLNDKAAINARYQQRTIVFAIIALLIFILLSAIAFVNYRKKQKINLQLQEQIKEVKEKSVENEMLLGEIHHRVKNNLQVISSLLSLQGKSITDLNARNAIEEGKQRVRSMELVHKMLYEGNRFSYIEIDDFTRKLAQNLFDSFGVEKSRLIFNLQSPVLKLDIDTAIPVALIVNELLVNSLKYAYLKDRITEVNITIEERNGNLWIEISDNGPGTNTQKLTATGSFGLKLVKLLTKQLNGEMEVKNLNGLKYIFVLKEYKIIT